MIETPATPDVYPGISILYRDARLLAVSKPSGMIVHRGWDNDAVTLADVVRDKIIGAPIHAVHRLDRGTSGIVLFALDSETARFMQQALSEAAQKRYVALVRGPMLEPVVLDHAIRQRDRDERVDAVTEFYPLGHSGRWSLVEARPRTGRLHQIRKHLKHLSHPVVGDTCYGKGDVNRYFRQEYGLARLALHAIAMEIRHPAGHTLHLWAPLPADLMNPLERLDLVRFLPTAPSTPPSQLQ